MLWDNFFFTCGCIIHSVDLNAIRDRWRHMCEIFNLLHFWSTAQGGTWQSSPRIYLLLLSGCSIHFAVSPQENHVTVTGELEKKAIKTLTVSQQKCKCIRYAFAYNILEHIEWWMILKFQKPIWFDLIFLKKISISNYQRFLQSTPTRCLVTNRCTYAAAGRCSSVHC